MRVKRRLQPWWKRREELGEPLGRNAFRRMFKEIIIDRLAAQDIAAQLGLDPFFFLAQLGRESSIGRLLVRANSSNCWCACLVEIGKA